MPDRTGAIRIGSLSAVMDEIDDWCGTKPHRKFPPKPHGVRDLLISVAIHNLAGQISDAKAREQLQGVASQVFANAGRGIGG